MEKLKPYVFLILAGALYSLGYPTKISMSLIVTPIIGVSILFYYILNEDSFKKRLLMLLCFNLSFNMISFYWIADTLMEFGQLPYPIALILNALFTLIITPHFSAALITMHLFRSSLKSLRMNSVGLSSFLLALSLTLFEYFIPQQFNLFLGQPLIAVSKYLGFAHIAGLPIYSFFSYLLVFEIINIFQYKKFSYINYATIFIFILLNPILVPDKNQGEVIQTNIRLVQANISNFLKIDSEKGTYASVDQVINRYQQLSMKRSYFLKSFDLIVWPETAFPYSMKVDNKNINQTSLPNVVRDSAIQQDSQLFIGGYDSQSSPGSQSLFKTEHNTAFHISKSGELIETYNKRILIPFGETLPFGRFNKYISRYIENISFFKEGNKFTLFNLNNGSQFISTICYELLKPRFIREYLNSVKTRPHFMINLTNDSWYGKTMEPEQHLFLAKWRALEFNIPIIRSTNTGISSVIYPDATESRRMGIFKTGNLDLKLSFSTNQATIYQKWDILPLILLWVFYFIFHLLGIKLKDE